MWRSLPPLNASKRSTQIVCPLDVEIRPESQFEKFDSRLQPFGSESPKLLLHSYKMMIPVQLDRKR